MAGSRKLGRSSDHRRAMLRGMVTYLLENGRIAEIGRHEELIARQGVYAAFYREQAEWYDESGEGGV